MLGPEYPQLLSPYSALEAKARRFESIKSHPETSRLQTEISVIGRSREGLLGLTISEVARFDPQINAEVQSLSSLAGNAGRLKSAAEERNAGGDGRGFSLAEWKTHTEWADYVIAEHMKRETGRPMVGIVPSIIQKFEQGRYGEVIRQAQQLEERAQKHAGSSEVMWGELIKKGYADTDFQQSFEEILDMLEVGQVATAVKNSELSDEDKKTFLARTLLDRFGTGRPESERLDPVLLEEIADGKFEITPDYAEAIVDTYIQATEGYEKYLASKPPETPAGPKYDRKRRRLLQMAGLTIVVAAGGYLVMQNLPGDKSAPKGEPRKPEPKKEETSTITITGPEDEGSESEGFSTKNARKSKNEKPKNSDIDPEEASNATLWELETGLMGVEGYFRESTAERYDTKAFSWAVDDVVRATYTRERNGWAMVDQPGVTTLEPQGAEVAYAIKGRKLAGSITIPVRPNERPLAGKIIVKDASGQEVPFAVKVAADNTYTIETGRVPGGEVDVYVPVTSPELPLKNEPTEALQYSAMRKDALPQDLQDLLDRTRSLPELERAKAIETYFKSEFTYSLDSRWSNFYDQSANPVERDGKVFDVRRVDCDVANDLMARTMRLAGLRTRMEFGFIHSGFLSRFNKKISALEAHGWVGVYDYSKRKWVTFDGTPTSMDDYTLDKFSRMSGQTGGELPIPKSLKEAIDIVRMEAMMLFYMMRNLGRVNAGSISVIQTVLMMGGAVGAFVAYITQAEKYLNKIRQRREGVHDAVVEKLTTAAPQELVPSADMLSERFRRFARGGRRYVNLDNPFTLMNVRFWLGKRRMEKSLKTMQTALSETEITPEDLTEHMELLERLTGADDEEVGEAIERTNIRSVEDSAESLRQRMFREALGPFRQDLFRYFDGYQDKYGRGHDWGEGWGTALSNTGLTKLGRHLDGDLAERIQDPHRFSEEVYRRLYWSISQHIKAAERLYSKKKMTIPKTVFPSTYPEFRATVSPRVDRFLMSYWMFRNGEA